MKAIILSSKRQLLKFSVALPVCLLILLMPSCQKDELERNLPAIDQVETASAILQNSSPVIYFGPETFTIVSKEPLVITRSLSNPDFGSLENFVLKVQNGTGGNTKVTKMEISIDGIILVTYADFRKRNLNIVMKELPDLTETSVLEIKLDGSRGRFISVSIEGTLKENTIIDIDGNLYPVVEICGRWWMAENLRTTRFNDGTPIDNVTDNTDWIDHALDMVSGYCWYNNDPVNKDVYGALYNWVTALSGNNDFNEGKHICPAGWHVPDSHYDLYEMLLCLDPDSHETIGVMSEIAGGMLKEAGTVHWLSPNTGATNSTGFNGLPGGKRDPEGSFSRLSEIGTWWSDKGLSFYSLTYNYASIHFSEGGDEHGFSIRCVKDE